MLDSSWHICFLGGSCFIYILIVFIYACWCPTQFPYQIMFVSFNNTTWCVTCGVGTANLSGANECTPGFWPLYCLFYFDLRSWLPFCIFENEINFDETTIRFNSVVKQRIFISKMKKKIIVLNWSTMQFIDWYRTGEML
jgi:hypothetical protein